PDHVLTEIVCTAIIIALCLVARMVAGKPEEALVPSAGFSLRGMFELVVEGMSGLVESVMGPHNEHIIPLVGSVFIYILINNFFGLFPGFSPATDNLNTTLACGLF